MPRKPTSGRTTDGKWNLVTGEDSYAGQNAQNPNTARKMQSFIPQDDGQLHRELVNPKYLPTQLSGPVVGLYQFVQTQLQSNGTFADVYFYFAAARTDWRKYHENVQPVQEFQRRVGCGYRCRHARRRSPNCAAGEQFLSLGRSLELDVRRHSLDSGRIQNPPEHSCDQRRQRLAHGAFRTEPHGRHEPGNSVPVEQQ